MSRPVGSKNKKAIVATVKVDDYAQAFSGAGTRRDPSSYVKMQPAALMGEAEANNLYIGDGFARQVVDIPAEEMTRAGFTLDGVSDDVLEKVQARVEELDVMHHLNDALRWSRLHGGAVVVMGLNDGAALDTPLNPDGVKSLEFLRTYDRWQATIQNRYLDPMKKEFGQVEFWNITPTASGAKSYIVHSSRVLVFQGEPVPERVRVALDGWGGSVLQGCRDALQRLGMSYKSVNSMMERSQQAVHGIPGLAATLMQKNGADMIQKRVDVVDMVRGYLNTIVIDAQETYELKSTSMAGVPDVLDRFAEAVSAVSGIPVYLLMGRSPGGLNATGASNQSAWFARIGSMQNNILRKPLDFIIQMIMRGISATDGGSYKLCFNPLYTPTDAEQAEADSKKKAAEKSEMEMHTGYINAGVLDPAEIRKELAKERFPELDLTLEVTPPDIARAEIESALLGEREAEKAKAVPPKPAPKPKAKK
jgi:phage-related protein (TIGR01555 family)